MFKKKCIEENTNDVCGSVYKQKRFRDFVIIKSKSRISCSSSSLYQQNVVCCESCIASCQNGAGDLSHGCVQYESGAQCADVIVICNQRMVYVIKELQRNIFNPVLRNGL